MRRVLIAAVALLAAAPALAQPATNYTDLVNPFIGTGGHGHTYPGPSLPFGMIQPGPDTRLEGWDGCSGYHYSDSRLYGFSHTHLSGTGIPDYTDVLLMPTTGDVRLNNGADGKPGYSSTFSHDEEVARPGYYAVTLRDHGIRAELTTTLRVGIHRYALPKGKPANVILDLEHRDRLIEGSIGIVNDREVAGVRRSRSWARDQVVYYVIRFSRPFAPPAPGAALHKRAFAFGSDGGELLVKVAISAVSIEGARKNLDAELPHWDFDRVRRDADAAWQRELAKIHVDGGTPDQRTIFYTALYHSMLAPNVYMDVDGQYRGRDFKIHKADGFTYYSVFSLWDTYRALHPLLTIIDTARTRDFIKTFLAQYQQGGRLPVWELAANETDTMIGYHAVPVIADAIAKGVGGFDVNLAFEAMKHSAELDHFGLDAYKRQGFIDASEEGESVSKTLEYAFDDWTIAQVAQRLGRTDDHRRYMQRSQSWMHVLDPLTGFMRARVEGFWMTPFDPAEVNSHYTEANAWQYSFSVPHDVPGLARLLGGYDMLEAKLDALFAASTKTTGREQADITGLIGQYAHGNEPSHHIAYLYALVGRPSKTQQIVRRIMDEMYAAGPDGLAGNEDCGQMSAWYVFSALGFYPVAPGSTQYVVGSPLFPRAVIRLENGQAFTIEAPSTSAERKYAAGPLTIEHSAIARGGELYFRMFTFPNDPPPLLVPPAPEPIATAPFIDRGARVFRGSQPVKLGAAVAGAIHYTLDGSEPTERSPRYTREITIDKSVTLKAIAVNGGLRSPVISAAFRHLADYPKLTFSTPYAPQYAAAGDDTLIDGLRGNNNFRTGRWQGWQGEDVAFTIDLGEARDVQQVTMGFLQDIGSWIFFPKTLKLETSLDGRSYQSGMIGGIVPGTATERDTRPTTRDQVIRLPTPRRARFVRVTVQHYGKLPAWHLGAGGDAWFFADELVVRSP